MYRISGTHSVMPTGKTRATRAGTTRSALDHIARMDHIAQTESALCALHPDLLLQRENPSAARKAHDAAACDRWARTYAGVSVREWLVDKFIDDTPGVTEHVASARHKVSIVLEKAYEASSTFRRLFHYAIKDTTEQSRGEAARTGHLERRWTLCIEGPLGTVLDNERREITLNLAPWESGYTGPRLTYQSAHGEMDLSPERAYLHQIVRALTGLCDDELGHARGPNVEYLNLICKEMGYNDPACTAYACHEDRFASSPESIDLGFGYPSLCDAGARPASVLETDLSLPMPPLEWLQPRCMLQELPGSLGVEDLSVTCTEAKRSSAPLEHAAEATVSPGLDELDAARTLLMMAGATDTGALERRDVAQRGAVNLNAWSGYKVDIAPSGQASPPPSAAPGANAIVTLAFSDLRVQLLDAMRAVVSPVVTAGGTLTEEQQDELIDFLKNPNVRATLFEELALGPKRCLPKELTSWWIDLIHTQAEANHLACDDILTLLTEHCSSTYVGNVLTAVFSDVYDYANEAELLVSLLGTVTSKIATTEARPNRLAPVRETLLRAKGARLHGVGIMTCKSRNIYDWLANSTSKNASALVRSLMDLDLVPSDTEYSAVRHAGLASRFNLKYSPYNKFHKRITLHIERSDRAPLPALAALPTIANKIVTALSDERLIDIDNAIAERLGVAQPTRVRAAREMALRGMLRTAFLNSRRSYLSASSSIYVDPQECDVIEFVDKQMESDEMNALLEGDIPLLDAIDQRRPIVQNASSMVVHRQSEKTAERDWQTSELQRWKEQASKVQYAAQQTTQGSAVQASKLRAMETTRRKDLENAQQHSQQATQTNAATMAQQQAQVMAQVTAKQQSEDAAKIDADLAARQAALAIAAQRSHPTVETTSIDIRSADGQFDG